MVPPNWDESIMLYVGFGKFCLFRKSYFRSLKRLQRLTEYATLVWLTQLGLSLDVTPFNPSLILHFNLYIIIIIILYINSVCS